MNGVVFTLPTGYRPAGTVRFLAQDPARLDEFVRVTISATGEIFAALPNVELPVSLDGISFRCGPPGGASCP